VNEMGKSYKFNYKGYNVHLNEVGWFDSVRWTARMPKNLADAKGLPTKLGRPKGGIYESDEGNLYQMYSLSNTMNAIKRIINYHIKNGE